MAEIKEQLWIVLEWQTNNSTQENVDYYKKIMSNENNLNIITNNFELSNFKQTQEYQEARNDFLPKINLWTHLREPAYSDWLWIYARAFDSLNPEKQKELDEQSEKERLAGEKKQEKEKLIKLLDEKLLLSSVVYSSDKLEEIIDDWTVKWESYKSDYSKPDIDDPNSKIKEMLDYSKKREYTAFTTMDKVRMLNPNTMWSIATSQMYSQEDDSFIWSMQKWAEIFWNKILSGAKSIWSSIVNGGEFVAYNIKDFIVWWWENEELELSEFNMKYDVLKKYNDTETWFSAMLVRDKSDWALTLVIRWTDDRKDAIDDISFVSNNSMPTQLKSWMKFIEELKKNDL